MKNKRGISLLFARSSTNERLGSLQSSNLLASFPRYNLCRQKSGGMED
ncbi:MAG: hypothetical protein J6C82_02335 [Clostridia bacterium]|nr:hypothetical protein [Clostridia bacterium]